MSEPIRPDAPPADTELARYLAAHASPAMCADALIRDSEGRILLVDPVYKDGWDLPGGMLEDEEPVPALRRELDEELGLAVEVGRLLVFDTAPRSVWGRTIVSLVYAAHTEREVDAAQLVRQDNEIREVGFYPEDRALELLAPAVARRLAAALAAERGAHTAVLRDGYGPPPRPRDHYAQLSAPMMAATVLLTDTAGRVLVLEPSYKDHLELPGGMVEAQESPAQAASRELREELGLDLVVSRLVVVHTTSAADTEFGRALTCLVYAAPPLASDQADGLTFPDGEILAAHWLAPEEAARRLPSFLAARVDAALEALRTGGIVHLDGLPPDTDRASGVAARQADQAAVVNC